MSFDRRIRDELRRAADAIEPDVDRNLGAVEARARRRDSVSPGLLLGAAVVLVVVSFARFGDREPPNAGGGGPSHPAGTIAPSSSPGPSTPASYLQIAGTYLVTLDGSNAAVNRDGVAGAWTLRLRPDGVALVSSPPSFQPGATSLSGVSFSLVGDRFRTNLFYNDYCDSIGTYAWTLAQGRLTLTPVDETCPIRRTLLGTLSWVEAP